MTDLLGYFALHRSVWANNFSPIKEKRKFTRFEAWNYLISEACHKNTVKYFNGILIPASRGEVVTSIRDLAETWRWDRDTVKRFLFVLENEGMIGQKSSKKATTLKLIKYDTFQPNYKGNAATDPATDAATEPPLMPPLLYSENYNDLTKTKNHDDVSSETSGPSKKKKTGKPIAEEAKALTYEFRSVLEKAGQSIFGRDWNMSSARVAESLLKREKSPDQIRKVMNWAVKTWDCRNTVSHFKHIEKAWPHYEKAHPNQAPKSNPHMDAWKAGKRFRFIPTGQVVEASALIPINHNNPGRAELATATAFKSSKSDEFEFFREFEIEEQSS